MQAIRIGEQDFDAVRAELRSDGQVTRLSQTECACLAHLAGAAGRTVSREELLRDVWGYADGVLTRTVDTTMRRLRRKLEPDPSQPRHLITVHGEGYRLEGIEVPLRLGDLDEAASVALLGALGLEPLLARKLAQAVREASLPEREAVLLEHLDPLARGALARLAAWLVPRAEAWAESGDQAPLRAEAELLGRIARSDDPLSERALTLVVRELSGVFGVGEVLRWVGRRQDPGPELALAGLALRARLQPGAPAELAPYLDLPGREGLRARLALGQIHLTVGRHSQARACAAQVLASGDGWARARALRLDGLACLRSGDLATAESLFADARVAALESGQHGIVALCVFNAGVIAVARGDGAGATARFEQALALQEARGDTWSQQHSRAALAQVCLDRGRPTEVLEALAEICAAFRREGAQLQLGRALANLGAAQLLVGGDPSDALAEATRLAAPTPGVRRFVTLVSAVASLVAGDRAQAGAWLRACAETQAPEPERTLVAALQALASEQPLPLPPDDPIFGPVIARLRGEPHAPQPTPGLEYHLCGLLTPLWPVR